MSPMNLSTVASRRPWITTWAPLSTILIVGSAALAQEPLPKWLDARPLTETRPIDEVLLEGVDRFLLDQIEKARRDRPSQWAPLGNSGEAHAKRLAERRARLRKILGAVDARHPVSALELVATTSRSAELASSRRFRIYQVRWPVVGPIHGEGLLLEPIGARAPRASVVAIPDADLSPEQWVGLVEGLDPASQLPRWLAESGCRVVVPMLIDRQRNAFAWHGRRVDVTNREFLYRSAFELGRHLVGYELQKVLALVDWFEADSGASDPIVGVAGWGEGGMLALYAGALDPRIDATLVSGHFGPRETLWQQPIDRNVFGLLETFGDAELAVMIAPRGLVVEAARGPQLELSGGAGAPAVLRSPPLDEVGREWQRALGMVRPLSPAAADSWALVDPADQPFGSRPALEEFLEQLGVPGTLADSLEPLQVHRAADSPRDRMWRQMQEIDQHNQWLLRESQYVRSEFMSELDTSSLDAFQKSQVKYREKFYGEVIGRFELPLEDANPRVRPWRTTERWSGYEVVLDVFPDVIAYGILLVPNDLEPGERRPVVVCQHGLEGRCQDVIEPLDHPAYKGFAARLAEQGFITFAPQNLYRHRDRFRSLQRKANPLGKTLFSIITPQHQQIVDWLQSLEIVDPERIGFYGLSYGGKTAMRVPAIVTDYCLSICSADFNEWVDKNASTRNPHSYVFTGEYEIFEFDLGSTFNYAEMAALIAPRPFMVERGHFDGVASDETVGWEFAKVRHLYAARLKIPDRCRIEWFDGPHTINGVGTFEFLREHLDWRKLEAE